MSDLMTSFEGGSDLFGEGESGGRETAIDRGQAKGR